MKIEQMPIKDRFDDCLEFIVLIKSELDDNDLDPEHMMGSLDTLFRRLEKLKGYVLEELKNRG